MADPTIMRNLATSVPEDLFAKVIALAHQNDRTVSAQVRRMLKDWFGAQELERRRTDINTPEQPRWNQGVATEAPRSTV